MACPRCLISRASISCCGEPTASSTNRAGVALDELRGLQNRDRDP